MANKGKIYELSSTKDSPTDKRKIIDSSVSDKFKQELDRYRNAVITDINSADSDLRRTMNANGYFRPEDMKFNSAFYRFPRNDPYNYVENAREYLFFTKPDLPLINDGNATQPSSFLTSPAQNINYFSDLAESKGYQDAVFKNLCYSGAKRANDGCPFIRILSNRKSSNMDVPDIQVEELETATNMFGNRILYPKSSQGNDEDLDFNIEFEDTRFLEVFHLFKAWDYYRILKWYGIITPASFIKNPNDEGGIFSGAWEDIKASTGIFGSGSTASVNSFADYTFHKVLHDHIRIFKFLVDSDGETLLYAASAIGCFPKTIQRSSFSEIPERGSLKITIGFKLSGWFEDNMTSTINDFNVIINNWQSIDTCINNRIDIYDYDIDQVSQELVDVPFIVSKDQLGSGQQQAGRLADFKQYYLKWAKKV